MPVGPDETTRPVLDHTEVTRLSTGISPTDTSAKESSSGGRTPRRKTSHLKDVPETLELRESLRARCEEIAARLDRSVPMTKDQMEHCLSSAIVSAKAAILSVAVSLLVTLTIR